MNLRKFHALLSLPAVGVLSWLLITGLVMNHSHDLQLDKKPLPDALLFMLNAQTPENTYSWQLQNTVLSQVESTLFWEHRPLGEILEPTVFPHPYGWLIMGKHQLLLLDRDGLEITHLALPTGAVRLIRLQPVQLGSANGCFVLSEDYSSWRPCPSPAPTSQHLKPASKQAGRHAPAYAHWKISHALTWEQLLLKIHNFSVFGVAGKWLLDGLVLYLVAFIMTGILIRLKSRRGKNGVTTAASRRDG